MKFNKDGLIKRLKEKTTLAAIAGLVIVAFGLPAGSEEAIIGLVAVAVGLIYPEDE